MKINYLPAEKKDSDRLAEMINIASDGAVEYLFHDLVPGSSPVEVVSHSLKNDYYPHSYKSAIVAKNDGQIVGMVLSYPSSHHEITDEMRNFFPEDRLEHFKHFFSSRVENSWFIDAICVSESYRKKGIGKKLISLTKEKALENGFHSLSLIVFADNDLAIPVYERTGFVVDKKVTLNENDYIRHKSGCLLMRCDMNP